MMLKSKLLMCVITIAVVIFIGSCHVEKSDDDTDPVSAQQMKELKVPAKKVFMGGSIIIHPDDASVNQVNDGLTIPIRLAKYEEDDQGEMKQKDDSVKYGFIRFVSVSYEEIKIDAILRAHDNEIIAVYTNKIVKKGSSLDLDNDGIDDISLTETGRSELGNALYINFICSKDAMHTTMYQLLPEYYDSKEYPSGIAGVTVSKRLLVIRSMKIPKGGKLTRSGLSMTGADKLLKEGDIVINVASANGFVKGSRKIAEISKVTRTRNAVTYTVKNQTDKDVSAKAFEALFMDVTGLATEIDDSPAGVARRNKGTYHIFERSFKAYLEPIKDHLRFSLDAKVGLDFYIYARLNIWGKIELTLSAEAILKGDLKGSIEVYKKFKKKENENLIRFARPSTAIMVGPVPVEIAAPISLGYEAYARGKIKVTYGIQYKGRMGFSNFKAKAYMDWWRPRLKVTAPRVVNVHEIKPIEPTVTLSGDYTIFPYLNVTADVAPGYIIHAKVPLKLGIEGQAYAEYGCPSGKPCKTYWDLKVNKLAKIDNIQGSVGFMGKELGFKIPFKFELRKSLFKWEYAPFGKIHWYTLPIAHETWKSDYRYVTSPRYPSYYTNRLDKWYTFYKKDASKMRVRFAYFNTEKNYDKVYIYNKDNKHYATYHGSKSAFQSIEVPGDTLKVRLKTDGSVTRKGFKIDRMYYLK